MGAPVLAGVARMVRRGVPLVLVVAVIAGVLALTSAAGRTSANESSEGAAEAPAAIEPSAPRRTVARDEKPAESARSARSVTIAQARGNEPARPGKLAAGEPSRRESKPSLAEAARVAPAAEAKPASTPSGLSDSLMGVGAKLLLGSLLLAGLLYGAAYLVRRMPIARLLPGSDGPIKVIGRTPLAPKVSLALVQAEGATVLVAVSPSGVQTLHTWATTPAGAGASSSAARAASSTPAAPGQLRGLANRLTEGR
jgi:flagellar biogenesis protein FliO